MTEQIRYIDLFAGCGGLSLGLYQAGLKGIFAIEKNPDAFSTLKFNLIDSHEHFEWPNWLPQQNWDINHILDSQKDKLETLRGKVDLVVGGPPCQGFSMTGQRVETDIRNKLIYSYLNFVEIVQPRAIIFENVYGFTLKFSKSENVDHIAYSELVIKKLNELGYPDANGKMIDMAKYGVPQHRKRFIVIATRENLADKIFSELEDGSIKFLKEKNLKPTNTTLDAISDLEYQYGTVNCPDKNGFMSGVTPESKSSLQKYLRIEVNKPYSPDSHRFVNHRSNAIKVFSQLLAQAPRNKRLDGVAREPYGIKKRNVTVLDPSEPSLTITTIPDDFIHYSEPRVMTVRECARLQTFPDWFEFKGPYTTGGARRVLQTPRYTQVGNAVPPLFARQLGLAVRKVLENE